MKKLIDDIFDVLSSKDSWDFFDALLAAVLMGIIGYLFSRSGGAGFTVLMMAFGGAVLGRKWGRIRRD